MSKPTSEPDTESSSPVRLRLLACGLIALGGILGLSAIAWQIHRGHIAGPQSLSEPAAGAQGPSSLPLSQEKIDSYSVPSIDPKYIAIPAIKVAKSPVIKLGLLKSGSIATPNNIFEAGWFADSTRPGQKGAMFIYGHLSSWKANGIFYNLKQLRPKDTITITTGDNRIYSYVVVRMATYPYDKVPMDTVLSPSDSTKPGLNLMTCTGKIIKGTSEFSERLVVYTSLVGT
jgi:sortase (surface protein transpeptidase)